MGIYEKEYYITVGDVDKKQRVKPSYLFDVFQELTTVDGDLQGVGLSQMQEAGMAWVLSRFSVIVDRRPLFGEKVKASTWPCGPEKIFMLRDYLFNDSAGLPIVRSRSRWLILDTKKRSLLRPSSLPVSLPDNEERNALICDYSPSKREGLVKIMERKAVYSDVDFNGHVNNARYIQWVQDAVDPELIEDADQMRIDINYVSETRIGETLDIFCTPFTCEETNTNNLSFNQNTVKIAIEGIKRSDGLSSFRAELRLKNSQL